MLHIHTMEFYETWVKIRGVQYILYLNPVANKLKGWSVCSIKREVAVKC
uniref:Uncharacterized protein n=1 Tax=Setaria italica TaxID=4555 RepID=K4AND2_SETIT